MIKHCILLLVVVLCASTADIGKAISTDQIRGLKKLLKGLDSGVFTTCSIVFFSEKVTYDEADLNCRNFDIGSGKGEQGNLVTINDEEKNKDLQILLEMAYPEKEQPDSKWTDTKWVWAGLRKTKNNKAKKPGPYKASDWAWFDGSNPTDYFKWMSFGKKNAQPDQAVLKKGKKGCNEDPRCFQNQMRINHGGQWDDTWKFKTHPYACDYKGKYVLSNEPKTWESAKEACAAAGLHLAKVRNAGEIEEMKSAMVYFLGKADESWKTWDHQNWIWLGGNDLNEEAVWKWLDGEEVETWDLPWRTEAGNDNAQYLPGKGGQHALAISRWGQFDDSFHDHKKRKRPFACQCPGS